MRRLKQDEIKKIELNMLIAFAEYCDKNNLTYYLMYGTLLGAVRHKGFIPWDDDIDVIMHRKDYDRFRDLQMNNKCFDYYCIDDNTSSFPFIKIVDKGTWIKHESIENTEVSHLWIDIFPMDFVPENEKEYARALRHTRILRYLLDCTTRKIGTGTTKSRAILKIPFLFLCRLMGRYRLARMLNNYSKSISVKSKYVKNIAWERNTNRCLFDDYKNKIKVGFEGHDFWAPAEWNRILTNMYGDFMKLPPPDKRISHEIQAFMLETDETI